MKKVFIVVTLFLVGLCVTVGYSLSKLSNIDEEMKSNIGNKIIIEGDTVTIVDYSMINENYTLSNGTKVNRGLVDKSRKL